MCLWVKRGLKAETFFEDLLFLGCSWVFKDELGRFSSHFNAPILGPFTIVRPETGCWIFKVHFKVNLPRPHWVDEIQCCVNLIGAPLTWDPSLHQFPHLTGVFHPPSIVNKKIKQSGIVECWIDIEHSSVVEDLGFKIEKSFYKVSQGRPSGSSGGYGYTSHTSLRTCGAQFGGKSSKIIWKISRNSKNDKIPWTFSLFKGSCCSASRHFPYSKDFAFYCCFETLSIYGIGQGGSLNTESV